MAESSRSEIETSLNSTADSGCREKLLEDLIRVAQQYGQDPSIFKTEFAQLTQQLVEDGKLAPISCADGSVTKSASLIAAGEHPTVSAEKPDTGAVIDSPNSKTNLSDAQIAALEMEAESADYSDEGTISAMLKDPEKRGEILRKFPEQTRVGLEYMALHPEFVARITEMMPNPNNAYMPSLFFSPDKIKSALSDALLDGKLPSEEGKILLALNSANEILPALKQGFGSYGQFMPNKIDDFSVDYLTGFLHRNLYGDPNILSLADLTDKLTKPKGAQQVVTNYWGVRQLVQIQSQPPKQYQHGASETIEKYRKRNW